MSENNNSSNKELLEKYKNILKEIFSNIKYYLKYSNKYYNEIIDFCKNFEKTFKEEEESLENNLELNADIYYHFIAKALTTEHSKMCNIILNNLKLLIKNNFLLGNSNDIPIKIPDNLNDKISNRKVIDTIIESITDLDNIYSNNDDIYFNCIEVLNEIINNEKIDLIYGKTFEKIYLFYFRIYKKITNKDKLNNIKEKIHNFTLFIFNKLIELNNNNINNFNNNNNIALISRKNSLVSNNSENSNKNLINIYNKIPQLSSFDINQNFSSNKSLNLILTNINSNYSIIDIFVSRYTKILIDQLCINSEMKINYDFYLIPKNEEDFKKPEYRFLKAFKMFNENNIENGFFGWCYVCRKTANYYDRNLKLPICSYSCKEKLENEEEKLKIYFKKFSYNSNCCNYFKFLCKILIKDDKNNYYDNNEKEKKISLELITFILENYSNNLNENKDFILLIQNELTEGLFKTCLSEEISIFKPSINLFFIVWEFFRFYLKLQISIFNENVFLKILDSENSSFEQKKTILEYFSKQKSVYFIELYANYDIDVNEKFLVNRLATAFNRIVQGKFKKREDSFSDEQNYELISLSLKILSYLVEKIYEFCKNNRGFIDYNNNNQDDNTNNDFVIMTETNTNNNNYYNNDYFKKDIINENLRKKYELQKAAEKFNISIKNGISYLIKHNHIDNSNLETQAKDISFFLRNTSTLNKKKIGEYLGENNELALKVLKYFSESFDFTGIHIVQAFRIFLSTFYLCGEGQKIDRIVQEFASKYYNDNKNTNSIFESADAVYYLAFAVIILQTDLHNQNVKNKMDFKTFQSSLDKTNGGKNFPKEFLLDIYNQINEEPISLPELDEEKEKMIKSNNKEDNYLREKKRILNECSNKLKQGKDNRFIILDEDYFDDNLISSLMSVIWTVLLAMYSEMIESNNDLDENENEKNLIEISIKSMSNCIKIFGLLNLENEKKTFFNSFVTMTNLNKNKEIKMKNILIIKEILLLVNEDRNNNKYCIHCWEIILDLIERINFFILGTTGTKSEKEQIFNFLRNKKKNSKNIDDEMEIEKENMKLITKEITNYEKIFNNTNKLNNETIIEFISCLCSLAKKQFLISGVTKIFLLQKIVEVGELNINRDFFIFSKIWKIISEFLVEIVLGKNVDDGRDAMNSLRQLSLMVLQKKENNDFHFQKMFLEPFEHVFKETKDFVMMSDVIFYFNYLVKNDAKNIKSGWSVILNIINFVVNENWKDKNNNENNNNNDENNNNNNNNNNNIEKIQTEIFQETLETFEEISINNFKEILDFYPIYIIIFKSLLSKNPEKYCNILSNHKFHIKKKDNFKLFLLCYSDLLINNKIEIRSFSLSEIFNSINYGIENLDEIKNSNDFWDFLINQILINSINILKENIFNSNVNDFIEKIVSSLNDLIVKTLNLFFVYYDFNNLFFNNFLDCIVNIIFDENDEIFKIGIECVNLIFSNKEILSKNKNFFKNFYLFLIAILNKSLQNDFLTLNVNDFANYKMKLNKITLNCRIQLKILNFIEKLVENYFMFFTEIDEINLMLESLEKSYDVAYKFNCNLEIRLSLSNLEKSKGILGIFKQMKLALKIYFELLNKIYDFNEENEIRNFCFEKIMKISIKILNELVERNEEYFEFKSALNGNFLNNNNNEKKENENNFIVEDEECFLTERENIIMNIEENINNFVFNSVLHMQFFKNEKYKNEICKIVFELILIENSEIRENVKQILSIVLLNKKFN